MIRIVLDTNVFMSGIFWSGPPERILDAWQARGVDLVVSAEIIDEYLRISKALSKKYPGVDISPFIDMVAIHGKMFAPIPLAASVCRDPNDDMFIALALSSNTKIIVSGDKDLLDINGYAGIQIIKPNEFVEKYLIQHSHN
jgi:putative PIN family toxin of toxin-antitoxin system